MQRILKIELKVKLYKFQKGQDLTDVQKKTRLDRANELLRLHENSQLPNIGLSDEKNFLIEKFVNKQNDRIYLEERSNENLDIRMVTRSQVEPFVIVWEAVTVDRRFSLVFLDRGVKLNANIYCEKVLESILKSWKTKHFNQKEWTFQEDSASEC
ncbi:PREDICTED: uncharacterized protein LOC108556467 [Nicrophorus vespilloides]|uniref:Uncharacterized protein LOC108556467 n=1 Tax=Nicrophorus vespilloides TaxID=110193 RepID=A0ABM1M0I8_NICVS|nr:PREDICTED: uncharacterized protein LOC108556467 [Nicrophorus vespilloides]